MTVPVAFSSEPGGPAGHTYAVLLVRLGEQAGVREQLVGILRRLRFSGWVAPVEGGWVPVVAAGVATVSA